MSDKPTTHHARKTTYDDDVAAGVRAAEERRAAAERSRAVREDLKFCGEFTPAEKEEMWASVELNFGRKAAAQA